MNRPLPNKQQVLQWLENSLSGIGLQQRGHFWVEAKDGLPQTNPVENRLLVLVGNVGSAFWSHFADSAEALDGQAHPLDRWSQRLGDALAAQCGGRAYYPFGGPPYSPFQRWAAKAEGLGVSPLGLRLHPTFGLWHAYRFALVIPIRSNEDQATPTISQNKDPDQNLSFLSGICIQCSTKACLSACPVNAFSTQGYDVETCANYLNTPSKEDGSPTCMGHTCQARLACPVGADYRYTPAHGQFHMLQFALAHR